MEKYSITIPELIKRPSIRDDYDGDESWMNKMTDDEFNQFMKEAEEFCIQEGTPNKYPDINAAVLSKVIDRGILYKLLEIDNNTK